MSAREIALDALKNCRREMRDWGIEHPATKQTDAAIAALEAVQVEPVARDTIAVNLMRLAGLDKHKARECADIVQQIYATPQQSAPELDRLRASNAELTEEIYQLRASRVELLVALQKIAFEGDYSAPEGMKRIARAAIAKATREAS